MYEYLIPWSLGLSTPFWTPDETKLSIRIICTLCWISKMKEKGISEKLNQNDEIFYLRTPIFYWKLLTNSVVDVYESFDWWKFIKSLRWNLIIFEKIVTISSYFSGVLMLSPTVLNSLHSTDAIPPPYWCYPPHVLMLSPYPYQLSLCSTE